VHVGMRVQLQHGYRLPNPHSSSITAAEGYVLFICWSSACQLLAVQLPYTPSAIQMP
jgi:hypothetical protein